MARIVSGNSRIVTSGGLELASVSSEVVDASEKTDQQIKQEDFFNWCAARGYVSKEMLQDPACGENIFGYLAQNGVLITDNHFYAKAVRVLEKRVSELVKESSFREYKDALTPQDDIYRQFRVLRSVFEGEKNPLSMLILDQAIWDAFESCLKEYSPYISEFGSSTIDWRLDIRESYRYLSMLVQCGEELKEESKSSS